MSVRFQDHELKLEHKVLEVDGLTCVDCIARHGSTTVLCKVTIGNWEGFGESIPMTVNYSERMYAINRIPSGFSKREVRRDPEIITGRFIDSAIRPTIDSSFRFNISVNCIVLSYSRLCSPEALSVTAVSSSLVIAGVPCNLVAGISVVRVNNKWVNNIGGNSLTIAGNYYGVTALALASEQLSQEHLIEGIKYSASQLAPIIDFVRHKLKKYKHCIKVAPPIETNSMHIDSQAIIKAYFSAEKSSDINELALRFISGWQDKKLAKFRWSQLTSSVLRSHLLWYNKRPDGRDFDSIRPINLQKDILPAHSCLVSRGLTEVLCVTTLSNNPNEYQLAESLDQNENRKFIVHYNHLTELKSSGQLFRNEAEDNLIRNAIKTFMPTDRFIRVALEVIQSDGGAAMCAITGACVALQNSIEIPNITGVSIGLILQSSAYKFLADLTSLEQTLSDMELQLAGTRSGLTAVQLNSKTPSIPWHIIENAIRYGFGLIQKTTKDEGAKSKEKESFKQVEHKNRENKPKENKSIVIRLEEGQIARLIEARLTQEEGSVNGRIVTTTPQHINKVLKIALDSNKEVHFGRVSKITDESIDLILNNNSMAQIKPQTDISLDQYIVVTKGKFGRCSLVTTLEKAD